MIGMEKNRIQVFNKTLDKHLNDLAYFEDLITNHYLKFAYAYNIIAADEIIKKIDDVECLLSDTLSFILTTNVEFGDDLIHLLKCQSSCAWNHDEYSAEITKTDGNTVTIVIAKR
jgi:hypothetical protein